MTYDRGTHRFVRAALLGFSVMAIVSPWILYSEYYRISHAISNTTEPCYDVTGKASFDDCDNKGLPMKDRIEDAIVQSFIATITGEAGASVNAAGLIEDGCSKENTTNVFHWHKADGICLDSWTAPTGTEFRVGETGGVEDTCSLDLSKSIVFDSDTGKPGETCINPATCGIECSGINGHINKMSIGFFVENFKLNGKTLEGAVKDYVEEYVEPMPFDDSVHLDVFRSTGLLFRNMREFKLNQNLTIAAVNKYEKENTLVRELVRDIHAFSSEYYKFHTTYHYVLIIAILSLIGPLIILSQEIYERVYPNGKAPDNSLVHWVYTAGYFLTVFMSVVFFATTFASNHHVDMYTALDDLMVDVKGRTLAYGETDANLNNNNADKYLDAVWDIYDQHSILDRFRTLATWWYVTVFFAVLSLTAHFSVKYGPLMRVLRKEVDEMYTDGRAQAGQVSAKVPTAAKYLPLVSVVRA